jgi:hypothetical protein
MGLNGYEPGTAFSGVIGRDGRGVKPGVAAVAASG